jgi:hypothetical protein
MDRDFAPAKCRYCVRLATLMQHLRQISRGPHQWAVRPVSAIFVSIDGDATRYLLVGYSNPKTTGLPNNLVYGVPLNIHRGDAEAGPRTASRPLKRQDQPSWPVMPRGSDPI